MLHRDVGRGDPCSSVGCAQFILYLMIKIAGNTFFCFEFGFYLTEMPVEHKSRFLLNILFADGPGLGVSFMLGRLRILS
jgi:prepilin-type processing-associated H-X9-DG protein